MNHRERMIILLRRYAEQGKTLEWCAGKKIMGRSLATLKKYCRIGGITFPDYAPKTLYVPKPLPPREPDEEFFT